jgi:hypothetical protein
MPATLEQDAKAAWKLLLLADPENMSLRAFTQFVNEQFGRKYDPRELSTIFQKLQSDQAG